METQSPTPVRIKMSFDEAIKAIIKGKKVYKEDWEEGYWIELVESRLRLHKPDGKYYIFEISIEDLEGEDYTIIN